MRPISTHLVIVPILLAAACSRSPLAPASPGPQSDWSVFATSEDALSVSGTSSTNVYALGQAGTLLHYDGANWSASMPFDRLHWEKLWCVTPRDIFALGFTRTLVAGRWVVEYRLVHFDGSTVTPVDMDADARIEDIWGTSHDNVFAVGANGTIQHYDGSSWQAMTSGTTAAILAISGLATGELFAALQHAVLYYDGIAWQPILTTDEPLRDIWAYTHDSVFAVGDNGAVLHYDGRSWTLTRLPSGLDQVFGTTDHDVYTGGETNSRIHHFDGASWNTATLPAGGFVTTGIWANSPADVFAVGYHDEENRPPSILHFDGTAWHRESIPFSIPFNRDLTVISGNDRCVYVGGDLSAFMRFDGETWQGRAETSDYTSDIWSGPGNSLVVATSDGCISSFDGTTWTKHYCGGEMASVWATGLNDIFKVAETDIAHFDGRAWQSMQSNSPACLNDVWGRSTREVYAVGDSGTVIHYDGQSWQPMQSNTREQLLAIWGDAETAIAVGAHGTILHLADGRWSPASSPTTARLTGVWGASPDEIYAVGPRVVLHYDGTQWEILSDTLGGKQVWGRPGDGLYMLAADTLAGDESQVHVYSSRILRYGPAPPIPGMQIHY